MKLHVAKNLIRNEYVQTHRYNKVEKSDITNGNMYLITI